MSVRKTQRVEEMINGGYIKFWNEGYTPKEIADIFNISDQTVYNNLHIIAEKNGLEREDLLFSPNLSGPRESYTNPMKKEKVKAEELQRRFATAEKSIEEIIGKIQQVLQED